MVEISVQNGEQQSVFDGVKYKIRFTEKHLNLNQTEGR